jgi:hypothetical protein
VIRRKFLDGDFLPCLFVQSLIDIAEASRTDPVPDPVAPLKKLCIPIHVFSLCVIQTVNMLSFPSLYHHLPLRTSEAALKGKKLRSPAGCAVSFFLFLFCA